MKTIALIVAAGKGERAGGGLPKQYALLGGKSLIAHAVDRFSAHPRIGAVHVVIGAGQEALLDAALGGRTVDRVIVGGKERQDSVRAGLANMQADRVLIHDAARPLIPAEVIDRLLAALETSPGAVPFLPVADTLARNDGKLGTIVDRAAVVRVQTPQAFRYDAIMTSHNHWKGDLATDDAQMARAAGFDVALIEGSAMLDKITVAQDFTTAEAYLAAGLISRTGLGYDVHRLETGRQLWLGGVLIPFDRGLSGHSDADVALHALVDALLGAIAAGDIGDHFPPSDVRWKGADSSQFVQYARALINERGGIIDHVDLTIICEVPRIGPFREAIRARIAALLQIDVDRVSVKATTTERLGFAGRGEGIAAQAVATVRSR